MESKFNQQAITKRIDILLKDAMCSKATYAKRVDIDPGNFSKKMKGALKWTINDINKICMRDGISKEWLLDGEGKARETNEYEPVTKILPAQNGIGIVQETTKPRLPSVAMAGSLAEYVDGVMKHHCDFQPIIHQIPSYDFTIIIKGNSMEPKLEGGDEVACKRVYDIIKWGEVYVIDTPDGAVVKRVYDAGDKIRCVSYNSEEYPDFFIEKSNKLKFYKIVGLIRTAF